MKKTALLTIFLFSIFVSQAQYLRILDPLNWNSGQGTIEETKITYQPQGIYMQLDWEITFSAKGLEYFTENDTVEVEYHFRLPEEALITDSWLWFGDSILKGKIMDRWSANQIYENIVSRRRDPSILYKNNKTNYELRIFPMAAKKSRKVKLTILLPNDWSANSVAAYFPSENLLASKNPIDKINVFANLGDNWSHPAMIGEENTTMSIYNEEDANLYFTLLYHDQLQNNLRFKVNPLMNDGAFLSVFESVEDKFYQLAVLPLQDLELGNEQKVLFLFDYRQENSEMSQTELLTTFSNNLINLMNEKDSFNIFYHGVFNGFELQKASENWIPGDSLSVATTIENLGEEPFVSYSSLATLLAEGIKSAKEQEDVKIILMANSDNIDDIESANQLLKDLMRLAEPLPPVYIVDFQTQRFNSYRANNIWYQGNQYFYTNLAKLSGGNYCNSFEGKSFTECFQTVYQSAASENGMIDIHTTLENGFCYGRYNPGAQNIFSNLPYLEIGKYNGDFPMKVEVSGEYAGEIFSNTIILQKDAAIENDSILSQIWVGNEIIEMENNANYSSYSLINDIVNKSIENHILSQYTSFLCLEPGMMGELDRLDEVDEEWDMPVVIEEIEHTTANIDIYPNPFKDRVNIKVQIPESVESNNIKLEIFDLFGKLVKTFDASQFTKMTDIDFHWDATNQNGIRVPEGTYLFVCTTPSGRISKKLIVL